MTMETVTLDCGHEPTRDGIGAGYGRLEGKTYCYPCADEWAREDMRAHDDVFAYVSQDGSTITTWTGGKLARVSWHRSEIRHTPTGGRYERHYYSARGQGGSWHGMGEGPGMYVRLRRSRGVS